MRALPVPLLLVLLAQLALPALAAPDEGSDTPDSAPVVQSGLVRGSVGSQHDPVDWFLATPPLGGKVRVEVATRSATGIHVDLLDVVTGIREVRTVRVEDLADFDMTAYLSENPVRVGIMSVTGAPTGYTLRVEPVLPTDVAVTDLRVLRHDEAGATLGHAFVRWYTVEVSNLGPKTRFQLVLETTTPSDGRTVTVYRQVLTIGAGEVCLLSVPWSPQGKVGEVLVTARVSAVGDVDPSNDVRSITDWANVETPGSGQSLTDPRLAACQTLDHTPVCAIVEKENWRVITRSRVGQMRAITNTYTSGSTLSAAVGIDDGHGQFHQAGFYQPLVRLWRGGGGWSCGC